MGWEVWYDGDPNDAAAGRPVLQLHASCIVDGHMHINSGACAPMPILYARKSMSLAHIPIIKKRETIEAVVAREYPDAIAIQKLSTKEIGERVVGIDSVTYYGIKDSVDFAITEYQLFGKKDRELVNVKVKGTDGQITSIMILAPMDMEYAHLAGYEGSTIYHGEKEDCFFYERKTGVEPEKKGEIVSLSHEYDKSRGLKLHKWKKQYEHTRDSAYKYPFKEIPLYFYEPRRWSKSSGTKMTKHMDFGAWDEPFKKVATEKREGIFIGFKMYPPLGHRPFDEFCEYLPDFYNKCETENIPILTHCSQGGM